MNSPSVPSRRPDFFGQLAATNPFQARTRRLFERGQVLAVNGNQAELLVSYDAHNNPLELKQVPIVSGYVPRVGDWVAIQYEAGHAGAPWVTGPSMAADASEDSAGIGVFSVSGTEPAEAQKSTIYFDDSRAVWRGFDGTEWVDLSAKVHNLLPDLQGGSAAEYYHCTAAQHGDLQDLCGGDGIASAWVKRLRFKAIDQSATQRTRLFEKDGDFFWAINAGYDEVAGTWSRVDTTKYAYLMELRSENGIPSEPVGGIVWWRATPGANPLGAYNEVGGWELGFMMTQHRNFVGGGINFELDGSGTPPYGRFTQIAGNDLAGGHTLVQRNAWYEGGDSWGRDSHTEESAAVGLDTDGDLFVWWYPDSSDPNGGAPWATSAWQERARLHMHGDVKGRLDVIRSTSETAIACSAFLAKHKTSGNMADGFGAGCAFAVEDSQGQENVLAAVYGVRAGADNTGALSLRAASAGVLTERVTVGQDVKVHNAQLTIANAGEGNTLLHLGLERSWRIAQGSSGAGTYLRLVCNSQNKNLAIDTDGSTLFRKYDGTLAARLYHGTPKLIVYGDITASADVIAGGSVLVGGGGYLGLGHVASLPSPSSSYYRKVVVADGNYAGIPDGFGDAVYVCLKNKSGGYVWKQLCSDY